MIPDIRRHVFAALGVALLLVVGGVGGMSGCAPKPQESGFLSDYSHLEPAGETSLRYVPSNAALVSLATFFFLTELIEPPLLTV